MISLFSTLILEICSLRYKLPHLYIDENVSLFIMQDKSYFMTVSLPLWYVSRRW
jgi:hypothetical protein